MIYYFVEDKANKSYVKMIFTDPKKELASVWAYIKRNRKAKERVKLKKGK